MAQDNIIQFYEFSEKLNKVLATQIGVLDSAATNIVALNTAYGKLPSEYFNAIKQGLEIEKKKAQADKELITLEEKKNQTVKSAIPTLKQLTAFRNAEQIAINKANKEREREQKLLERTQGLYNQVQRGINSVTKEYQNLALRKELGGKLSAKEIVSLGQLEAKLNKYQNALKQVDANIGKHQRNVGNYKSGFDGLGMSVSQLSREMPAFANSVQTGFMAISNNLPIFFDEIGKLKQANKELAASGEPTKNVLKSVAGAIFSFQTLLSVGVTLLTVYGKDIYEWGAAMLSGSKSANLLAKSQEAVNKALTDFYGTQVSKIDSYVGLLEDVNTTEEERKRITSELIELVPGLTEEDFKYGNNLDLVKQKIGQYVLAQASRIEADTLVQENAEDLAKKSRIQSINSIKNEEERIKKYKEFLAELDNMNRLTAPLRVVETVGQKLNKTRDEISKERAYAIIKDAKMFESELDKELKPLTDKLNSLYGLSAGTQTKSTPKKEETTKKIKNEVEKRKDVVEVELELVGVDSFRKQVEDSIKTFESLQSLYIKGSKEYVLIGKNIDNLNGYLNQYENMQKDAAAAVQKSIDIDRKKAEALELLRKKQEEVNKANKDYINSFYTDFAQQSGFSELFKLIENFDTLKESGLATSLAISEAFQEAFNTINKASQANFDAEYDRLDRQKTTALKFANDSEAAKAEIEEKYQSRVRALKKKEALRDKRIAMTNIIINTAQAIAATIGKSGFAGIPLSFVVGAIGAAQLAIVASQKIPEFKDGVRDFGGGMAIVGDGGVSEIIRTDKGVFATPSEPTLVNLPTKTDVFKNHDEYFNSVMNDLGVLPNIQKPNITNNGINKDDLDRVIGKHFSKIKTQNLNLDKNGFSTFLQGQNSKTNLLDNRVSFKGFSV